jgi:glucose/arabinose dehydrogenase
MRVNWPQFNHDGGDMAFGGPDRYLYLSMGDGGGADDADGQLFNRPRIPKPDCAFSVPIVGHHGDGNAQKLNVRSARFSASTSTAGNSANGQYGIPADNPFVKKPGALPEIWAYGFRNPFRFSFDSKKGDLYVGDVGQNDIEE